MLVDVEVGGGRTGVADPGVAVALAQRIAAADGLEFVGVQGYNGNHQATVDFAERHAAEAVMTEGLRGFVDALAAAGLPAAGGGPAAARARTTSTTSSALLTEVQVGTYVFLDGNYADAVLRRDEPHPFTPSLTVRATVVSNAQPGFVITDAGVKELVGMGAGPRAAGRDGRAGRIGLPHRGRRHGPHRSAPGSARAGGRRPVEVVPPYCSSRVVLRPWFHCVRGDVLVDIWPVDARVSA